MFLSTSSNEVDGSDHEKETHHDGYDGFDDDYDDDDDDDEQLLSVGPSTYNNPLSSSSPSHTAGTYIRMEGWLNYTTSSHKDDNTIPPPSNTSSGGGGTSSIISKTSSKRKKSRSSKKNKQRYFVLRGSILSYYARRHDVKAKGTFVVTKGCTVGPVVFTSLDDATADSSHKQGETNTSVGGIADHAYEGEPQPKQPLSPSTKQQKKKQRHLYCVQVTWPTNNKPSKDEKFMAQAKAQVAAESEKEALQLQQQQQQDDSFDNDSVVNIPPPHNIGTKSPTIMRSKQFMRRSKSETVSTPQRKGSDSGTIRRSLHLDGGDIPPELSTPILSGDDNGDITDGVDRDITNGQKHVVASILPVSKLDNTTLNTPAAALSGSVAVPKKIPKVAIAVPPTTSESNAADKLNHETGLQKHYKHQIEKHTRDQQKTAEELQKVQQLISRKESHQKTKKKVIQGTKVAAGATAAITAGALTAGIGLAAGLLFVGITAAAGGSGAVVGSKMFDKARGKYYQHQSQKSFHLIIGASTYEEAVQWKMAMEHVIKELVEEENEDGEANETEQWRIAHTLSSGGEGGVETSPRATNKSLLSPPASPKHGTDGNDINDTVMYHDLTPKWVPIHGGGMALWGVAGGNLRIYREERSPHLLQQHAHHLTSSSAPYWLFAQPQTSPFPTIPRFRSDVGLVGQPFPPFKASISLKANSLDAFMCLMCSGRMQDDDAFNSGDGIGIPRIPVPNSGQIASFRIIETMDDHMDVIHLVFRPLYLFPSWTAPRDFVLYRFWKYDDDGTYQICFDSGEHRECPPITSYVRGEMHSVYTIAPLKKKKRRGTTATASDPAADPSRPNLKNEECLLSHVVQVDPRGWVPTTSSLPFVRNQGYGDAFAVMALNQMCDMKEALDTSRFVAVTMDESTHASSRLRGSTQRRLLGRGATTASATRANRLLRGSSGSSARGGSRNQHQIYMSESGDVSDDEADYDLYSGSVNESSQQDSRLSSEPPPTPSNWWAEPDANSFRVRGKTYKTDNKKVNAGKSLFRLFATDIVEVDVPIMSGMCTHPKERVQLALQREREKAGDDGVEMPPFVFTVNINMPGPPNYHMVFYYAVDDMSMIDGSDGTPSSRLCKEFFFGKDDSFRDNTFKLIPHIVEGNFMVRKAVGSTPAIMGNKIKQTYVQRERFFELIIDTGSSSVAAGVIRICNGYAKMIVVDLAFLFEGYDEETLPERVLGCIRLKNVDFGAKLRFVENES